MVEYVVAEGIFHRLAVLGGMARHHSPPGSGDKFVHPGPLQVRKPGGIEFGIMFMGNSIPRTAGSAARGKDPPAANRLDNNDSPALESGSMEQALDERFRIVVVDDDAEVYRDHPCLFGRTSRASGCGSPRIRKKPCAWSATSIPHLLLTDLKMPGMTGLDILKTVKQLDPGIEVILMTAHASAQTAVEAMKQGAYDYLIKPFKMIELQTIVSRIIRTRELILQNRVLKQQLSALAGSGMVFGTSP
jgi:FixJ family two-component response regulator